MLSGAVLAVPVGRWLDRHGGRLLMTAGSAAGVPLLLAWSQVDTLWQLYLVQIGVGAASAASLHEAAFAATIAGLLGVLSVAGRLLTTGLQRRYRTTTVTAAMFSVQAAAALLLPVVGANTGGAIGAVIGFGLGFGVATIAKPVLLAERYDTRRYATLAGVLVVPMILAKAAAPLAAAGLHARTGRYTLTFAAVAGCCVLAASAVAAAGAQARPNDTRAAARP
ncbi:hypothetical protein ACWKSP_08410 [Micromonosporaceae bacterium Da 78-11]